MPVNLLIAMLAGLAGAAATGALFLFGTLGAVEMFHLYDRDGGWGYVALFLGIIGCLIGLPAGIWLSLRWRTGMSGWTPQGSAAYLGIVVAGAIFFYAYDALRVRPLRDGPTPVLDFELQPPEGAGTPDLSRIAVKLQAGETGSTAWWDSQQQGNGILTGHLELYLKISERLVSIDLPTGETYLFQLRLPANPLSSRYTKYSKWHAADYYFPAGARTGEAIPAGRSYRMRYSVH